MASDVLVGIDLGTTILKAAAFDGATGRVLAQASQRLNVSATPDGRREQDPKAIDRALVAVLRNVRETIGARQWQRVAGLGLAAQGGSAVIADRDTGKALSTMILWNDARAIAEGAKVAAMKPPRFWRSFSWRDSPGAGLGRMRWMQKHWPQLINDRTIYAGAGEYVFFKLTGQWRQDAGTALQIGCYNVPKNRLDQRPLDLVNTDVSWVAPMRQGHEQSKLSPQASRRFGLPSDTIVVGPYMDHEAGYLSACGASRRPMQCSLGTAWVGNLVMPPSAKWSSPFQLVLPSPINKGYMVCQPLLTGNVTWDWALQTFVDADHDRALAGVRKIFEQSLLPRDGLVALPWLARPNPWSAGLLGGGAILGADPHTSREDMLRALAAGMAYEMARVFAQVRSAGVDALVLGGGASKGAFFRQLLAALFAPLPVLGIEDEDLSGVRGVLWPLSRQAAATRTIKARPPDRATCRRIADGYQRYLGAFERLYAHVLVAGPLAIEKGRGS